MINADIITGSTPARDGFYMPAEYAPHQGTVMIWPVRPGSWTNGGAEAQRTFAEIACRIAESEAVWMLASETDADHVREVLEETRRAAFLANNRLEETRCDAFLAKNKLEETRRDAVLANNKSEESGHAAFLTANKSGEADAPRHPFPIHVLEIPTDDAWARDVGPTCVVSRTTGEIRGIDWRFNAWGGDVDGLYADWEADNHAARAICRALDLACYDAQHFVMEGGAVHSDGEGTLLVTESCLLSAGRNPHLTKEQIEEILKDYLGAEKVIWLPCGIWQDETNEHVDNMCAFTGPAEVVLAWTDDERDPQYEMSLAALRKLEAETDARGRHIRVHKLPIPEVPVQITQEEVDAIIPEQGEDERFAGERLAASYVNFYITNGSVLVPQFGDKNDEKALKILGGCFPDRVIRPVEARSVIVGGGNIHCITQQIPAPASGKCTAEAAKQPVSEIRK